MSCLLQVALGRHKYSADHRGRSIVGKSLFISRDAQHSEPQYEVDSQGEGPTSVCVLEGEAFVGSYRTNVGHHAAPFQIHGEGLEIRKTLWGRRLSTQPEVTSTG
jgi:hypothetical protein